MFAIGIEPEQEGDVLPVWESEALGRITIGDFTERFRIPLGYWDVGDYRRSWCGAFRELEKSVTSKSCLMTSMIDPQISNFLMCWPLYREGDVVYIQNSIIFLDEVNGDFDTVEPWSHVGPRITDGEGQVVDEDGTRVSEWNTSMGNVREFYREFCAI